MSAQRSAASDENWASAASSLHSHAGFSAERTNSVGVFAATATVKQTAMRMDDEDRSGRCAQYAKETRMQMTRVAMSNATIALGVMGGEQAADAAICHERKARKERGVADDFQVCGAASCAARLESHKRGAKFAPRRSRSGT